MGVAVSAIPEVGLTRFFCAIEQMPSQRRAIVERVRGIAAHVAASQGVELVEAEWKGSSRGGTLRIFIDKEAGVTHGDCERVSKQLSVVLDVEDPIPSAYSLEVSSPGLDRKLFHGSDYRRFQGHLAKVRVREALNGSRVLTGRIEGSSDETVRLVPSTGMPLDIPFEDIELARLVPDL